MKFLVGTMWGFGIMRFHTRVRSRSTSEPQMINATNITASGPVYEGDQEIFPFFGKRRRYYYVEAVDFSTDSWVFSAERWAHSL